MTAVVGATSWAGKVDRYWKLPRQLIKYCANWIWICHLIIVCFPLRLHILEPHCHYTLESSRHEPLGWCAYGSMASFRVPALRHASANTAFQYLRSTQRRWAQVHDVRFLVTHREPDRVTEKYKSKLQQKAEQ